MSGFQSKLTLIYYYNETYAKQYFHHATGNLNARILLDVQKEERSTRTIVICGAENL